MLIELHTHTHTLGDLVVITSWNKFSTLEYQTQFIECEGSSMEVYYDTDVQEQTFLEN